MSVGAFLVKLVGSSVADIVNKPFAPITCFIFLDIKSSKFQSPARSTVSTGLICICGSDNRECSLTILFMILPCSTPMEINYYIFS